MSRSWWFRFSFLIVVTFFSLLFLVPTFFNLDLEKVRYPFRQKMNLGLDLQGGVYLVLGIDFPQVFQETLSRQASQLNARVAEKKWTFKQVPQVIRKTGEEDPRFVVEFLSVHKENIHQLLKKEFSNLRLTQEGPESFELGLSQAYRGDIKEKTVGQSIEVIRNRIDEFGVAEPSIVSQGSDRVVVELPGVKEVERAKELIGRTARLVFKRVDDETYSPEELNKLIQDLEAQHSFSFQEGQKFSEYVRTLNEHAKKKIPEGREIAFSRLEEVRVPYLLFSKEEVTGSDLQDAAVQIDPENQSPIVSFSLNPRGASLFDQVTGDHIGKRLAILLDYVVHSAPVIQSRISGGQGRITLGRSHGEAMMKEAKDLAIVLRAGALPAQLEFLEQRVVGPSLGQDSIRKGALASFIGSLAVFLFVAVYYRLSGVIAVVSLILNVLFVLTLLVALEATLTLPGIAGIALTVGIAVDSNVVIYERIREELRAGRKPFNAVDLGFQKAFRTILDANVTNAAAAMILLLYGTGPIKGFAVTLLVGILTTLFTAIFVCRLMFDFYLQRLHRQKVQSLSI